MNSGRRELGGLGLTNTAALAFGGKPNQAETELWNGTNWTEVNDLNTARRALGAAGSNTAGLAFGGQPGKSETESWNGTNWTELNDMNLARTALAGA
mgnify:FL=1